MRRASAVDAPELAKLRFDFRSNMGPVSEPERPFLDRCAVWMRERLAPGGCWRAWVAVGGGRIAGQVWLQLVEKMPNPAVEREFHGYVTNLYVAPEARGAALGSDLLDAALDYCRNAGVDSVILWPTEKSRTLYERAGFAVRDDVMEAVLDDGRAVAAGGGP